MPNAKVSLICRLYCVFLKVGVTKYCILPGILLPGTFQGPFSNTVIEPLSAALFGEFYEIYRFPPFPPVWGPLGCCH